MQMMAVERCHAIDLYSIFRIWSDARGDGLSKELQSNILYSVTILVYRCI